MVKRNRALESVLMKERKEGETSKDKRNRKEDFMEKKENVFKVVIPSIVAISLIICFIVYIFTRPKQ